MMRLARLASLAAALGATTALAGPVSFLALPPSNESAITVSVDQSALMGLLSKKDLDNLIEAGRQLFVARFATIDGAGRPLATQATIPTHFKHPREVQYQRASGPDSNACSSCHNEPLPGGAGSFAVNAFTSGGTESADFDNVDPQFSNERNTNHMFGSGLQELLAREMTVDLEALREQALKDARASGKVITVDLTTKGVDFGTLTVSPDGMLDTSRIDGIDPDLVVRPFSQKGVFPSLRNFTVNVLNAHHGMEADERFSFAMTGEADFDGDGVINEVAPGLVSALVAWQASLPAPTPVPFDNPDWQAEAEKGEDLFASTGCAACHVAALPLKSPIFSDPGPDDTAGTLTANDVAEPALYDLNLLDWVKDLPRNDKGEIMVPLYGDLKRHKIADNRRSHYNNELMGQSFVPRDTFMTAELWGVADTAPYGHRGDLTTLDEAILAHGGEATESTDAYAELTEDARAAIITFLKTMRMPQ